MDLDLDQRLRARFSRQFLLLETVLYIGVALLLGALALADVASALWDFFQTLLSGAFLAGGAEVLDRLLLVLILIELLHTVRISVRAQDLRVEPFLVVGLIAVIRRVLVITLERAQAAAGAAPALAGDHALLELGLLALLILVLVVALRLLHAVRFDQH